MKNYNCEVDFDLLAAKNVSKEGNILKKYSFKANKLMHDLLEKKPI